MSAADHVALAVFGLTAVCLGATNLFHMLQLISTCREIRRLRLGLENTDTRIVIDINGPSDTTAMARPEEDA